MKIVIVLLVAILFGIGGLFAGASMVSVPPERPEPVRAAGEPRDMDRELMESMKSFNEGAAVAAQRQQRGMIGGGVGVVVGLAAGVLLANRFGSKKKA